MQFRTIANCRALSRVTSMYIAQTWNSNTVQHLHENRQQVFISQTSPEAITLTCTIHQPFERTSNLFHHCDILDISSPQKRSEPRANLGYSLPMGQSRIFDDHSVIHPVARTTVGNCPPFGCKRPIQTLGYGLSVASG